MLLRSTSVRQSFLRAQRRYLIFTVHTRPWLQVIGTHGHNADLNLTAHFVEEENNCQQVCATLRALEGKTLKDANKQAFGCVRFRRGMHGVKGPRLLVYPTSCFCFLQRCATAACLS